VLWSVTVIVNTQLQGDSAFSGLTRFKRYVSLVAVIWTLVLSGSYYLSFSLVNEYTAQLQRVEERTPSEIKTNPADSAHLAPHVFVGANKTEAINKISATHLAIWLTGMFGLAFGVRQIYLNRLAHRQMETALRASERRFRDIAEISGDWIWEMDSDLRFSYLSDRFYEITGLPKGDFIGKTRLELAGDSALTADWGAHLQDLDERRAFQNFEYSAEIPSGEQLYFFINGKPVFNGDGAFVGYRGTGSNFTQRKAAEQEAIEKTAHLQSILDATPMSISLWDTTRRIVFVNKRLAKNLGGVPEDYMGKRVAEMLGPVSGVTVEDLVQDVLTSKDAIVDREFPNPRRLGHTNRYNVVPTFDADGEISGALAVGQDVTAYENASAALRKSEENFRSIVDNSPAAIVLKGLDGRFDFVNKRFLSWYCVEESEVLGKTSTEFFAGDRGAGAAYAAEFVAHDQEVFEKRSATVRENLALFADGGVHNLSVTRFPVLGADGAISGMGSINIDITQQKKLDQEVSEKSLLLRTILDTAPVFISFRDADGRFAFVNRKMADEWGGEPQDYIGHTAKDVFGHSKSSTVAEIATEVLQNRQPILEQEIRPARRPGRVFRYSFVPVFANDGEFSGVVSIGQDITAQRESEDAVRESEALLKTILDATPASISLSDREGRKIFVNKRITTETGITNAEFIGKSGRDLFGVVDGDSVDGLIRDVVDTEGPITGREIHPLRRPGQTYVYNAMPLFDENQKIDRVLVIGLDVTELKISEDAVRQNEALLRSIIDNSPTTISLKGLDGRFLLANKAFRERFHAEPSEIVGLLDKVLLSDDHFAAKAAQEREVIQTGEAVTEERDGVLPNGEKFLRLMTKFPVRDQNGAIIGLGTIGADHGALREAEENLLTLEDRFSEILRIAPEAIVSTDDRGKIIVFNEAAARIFGYESDEVIGKSLNMLLPPGVRKTHGRFVEAFASGREDVKLMTNRGEISGCRKDGSIFPAEASVSKLKSGQQTIFTVTMHDITDRKRVEATMQLALAEARKADRAKQDFLANMSHELRTPLNAIIGFSDVIKMEMFGALGNERYKDYVTDISSSAGHLLTLVKDILDLSKIEARKVDLERQLVVVGDVVSEAFRELRAQIEKKEIHFERSRDVDGVEVFADPGAMRQIVTNLLTNAVKFTPEGGRIGVSVASINDDFVNLCVWDTGIGIAEDDIKDVMKPFTQVGDIRVAREGGAGLGLSIVKALTELHGGQVEIDSTEGGGSRICVSLPTAPLQVSKQ
jgi:two-component system, cell cycle sensor histidine kinase PleC